MNAKQLKARELYTAEEWDALGSEQQKRIIEGAGAPSQTSEERYKESSEEDYAVI